MAALSPRNVGAIYVLLLEIVIFSIWLPRIFPRVATVQQVLNSNAVIGIAALALVLPLAVHIYDLSFAFVMSLSGATAAYLIVNHDMPVLLAMLCGLGLALVAGFINAFVVVTLGVDSLIATLSTGSLIQAMITFVTSDLPIADSRLVGSFTWLGQSTLFGITLPVLYMFVIAGLIWMILEYTPTGRRMYATGYNVEASRLAGITVDRLRFRSLLASSLIAGFGGLVLASTLGSGSPTAGTPYLLPAFATAILGATQFKRGRVNAWGTVAGVLMLGCGLTGLALAGAPDWSRNCFIGVVLLSALSATSFRNGTIGGRRVPWLRSRRYASAQDEREGVEPRQEPTP